MKTLRIFPLKKRADFLKISREGRSFATKSFVLAALKGENKETRVGFTVSSKNGNAVTRNRIKRRLKAISYMVLPREAKEGYDYVLIGRKSALTTPFVKMIAELEEALKKVK